MTTPLTPLHLKLLLHAYTSPDKYEPATNTSSRSQDDLKVWGLIYSPSDKEPPTCTEKGIVHIQQILNLPFPIQKWIGADGKEIPTP